MNFIKIHLKLIISLAFLLLALIFFVAFYNLKFNKIEKITYTPEQVQIVKKPVSTDKLPELFLKSIPLEVGAKITQNYNATSANGRFQATRTFETKKTLDENIKIYQDFLKKDGWNIKSIIDETNYKMIFAHKESFDIQVSLNNNTVSGINTVDISLTKMPGGGSVKK